MDTHIVRNKDGKNYNTFNEEVIECEICSAPTTMTGTKLCDGCWNAKGIFSESEKRIILDGIDCFIHNEVNHSYENEELKILIKKVSKL